MNLGRWPIRRLNRRGDARPYARAHSDIDSDTKLILSHTVGKRDADACDTFLRRLNGATTGRTQVTSDGFACYTYAVPMVLGLRCDFAQLIKTYPAPRPKPATARRRYPSGPDIVAAPRNDLGGNVLLATCRVDCEHRSSEVEQF